MTPEKEFDMDYFGKPSDSGSAHQEARIIPIYNEAASVEREIEQHLSSIRSLISRLRPSDRQNYFQALLNDIMKMEVTYPLSLDATSTPDADIRSLTEEDLRLVQELSSVLHRIYLSSGDSD